MEERHADLIVRYLNEDLSKEELDEFLTWINASQENKKMFFDIKTMYDAGASTQVYDVEASWNRFLRKRKKIKVQHTMINSLQRWSYAAVVFAITVISAYFFYNPATENQSTTRYVGGNGLYANLLVLPDGTKVHIGPQTVFYYKNDYGKKLREVYLEGEAYFEVAKQKDRPFIVSVAGQKIEALGTKFNVLAYTGDSLFVTTLLEGSVSLFVEKQNTHTLLKPNEQFIYNRNSLHSEVVQVKASEYSRWTEGYYYFREQNLEMILHRLSIVYGYDFCVDSEVLKQKQFTGTFYKGQNITEVLQIINESLPLTYKITGRTVTLYNK